MHLMVCVIMNASCFSKLSPVFIVRIVCLHQVSNFFRLVLSVKVRDIGLLGVLIFFIHVVRFVFTTFGLLFFLFCFLFFSFLFFFFFFVSRRGGGV